MVNLQIIIIIFSNMLKVCSFASCLGLLLYVIVPILQQICHRDLKLENTLLDGSPAPRLKICDFGYSKVQLWIDCNVK